MTVRAIWDVFRFHWMGLVLATVVGAAVGFTWGDLTQPQYTANAEVFVGVSNGQDVSQIAQGATYSVQQARNFAAVTSRQVVLKKVIDDLDLGLTPGQLRKKLSVTVPLNTSIISISITDVNANLAAEIANSTADSLTDSVDQLSPRANDGSRPVRVQSVERAVAPSSASSPNVPVLVFLCALAGFALTLIALVLNDFLRAKVRDPEHAAQLVSAPVIGTLSRLREIAKQPMAFPAAERSKRAEQYRQIRTSLRFLQMDQGHKVFVFTSAVEGEGKSTTAANVAASIAASGTSVCLVEGDLRRPSLGSILDLEGGVGLTNVIAHEAELDDVLQPWGQDGLHVLLAGETPPNPSEMLESIRAHDVLRRLRDRFEITIIDCPPVVPVTDAAILARTFGGAILVVSERQVGVRDVRRAVDRMEAVDAPILGVVVSKSRASGVSARYYDSRGREPREADVLEGQRRASVRL
ncbi:MAG: chromosome partitioning protein [Marmoricola sp.]|jgi:succinoglycan biosynthesis transport protein ExoP|nr:chromosome partitioning protein [Marmoricola sp.]